MELEIKDIPPLQPGELSLVDMHSVLNVANVLVAELCLLSHALDGTYTLLNDALSVCEELRDSLVEPHLALQSVMMVPAHKGRVLRHVAEAIAKYPDKAEAPEIIEFVANIKNVFRILDVRGQEILARMEQPDRWVEMPIAQLIEQFRDVFAAIEKNSKGRYRIIYNLAQQQTADYYIDLAMESINGTSLFLPLVMTDVLRDLIANARKYTKPGGIINVGVHEAEDQVRFVIQDTGCGIPAADIPGVVHYGNRGSNVADVRSMGGGLGLTKAFLVTKKFGGRFWIKSDVGVGTRITISLPRDRRRATLPREGEGARVAPACPP